MRAYVVVVALLAMTACKRDATPDQSAVASASASTKAPPIASSVALTTASASASAAPVASASAPAASSSAAARSTLPEVETLAVKSCPAPIARVKIGQDTVEAIGCPETKDVLKPSGAKSQLVLRDSNNKTSTVVKLTDNDTATVKLAVEDLYGDGKLTVFVTVTEPTMGSWGGPRTRLYEIENNALKRVRAEKKDGTSEDIELVSAIKVTWWLHAARGGRGQDIYEIRTNAENKDMGYRYAFEKGHWTVRSGPLKNWTGEHLKDTEAEFP